MPSATTMAEKASAYLVGGYLNEYTPETTADVIKAVLPPLSGPIIEKIKTSRNVIKAIAYNMLTHEIDLTDEEPEKFYLYYDQVFDIITADNSDTQAK